MFKLFVEGILLTEGSLLAIIDPPQLFPHKQGEEEDYTA
jgi:hypothetical protein